VLVTARALARSGELEQTVLTGRGSELARRLQLENLPVEPQPWRIGVDPRVLGSLVRRWRTLASSSLPLSRPLIHAHDAHSVALAAMASVICDAPFIASRRVDFPLRRLWPWLRARRVVAILSAVRAVLIRDGIPPARISVVHSGISPAEVIAVTPLDLRAQLRLPRESKLAVNVAALVDHKDHLTLLRAARDLVSDFPTLHWVIAGEGDRRRALESEITDLGLSKRVHLLGAVSQVSALIAAADLFVLSSRQEGLGSSILDAMALGIPVVATTAGGIPELVTPGTGVLSPPGDPRALADSVRRVLQDTQLRIQLAAAGRQRATEFTDDRMAAELLRVYRSVSQTLDGQ